MRHTKSEKDSCLARGAGDILGGLFLADDPRGTNMVSGDGLPSNT